jgi:hypothetical protein
LGRKLHLLNPKHWLTHASESECEDLFAGVTIRAAIHANQKKVTSDPKQASHIVELLNKGSNPYRVKLSGTCKSPLHFSSTSDSPPQPKQSWHQPDDDSEDTVIEPRPRWRNADRFKYGLFASDQASSHGAQQHEVSAEFKLTAVHSAGNWTPFATPHDGSVRVQCHIQRDE